MKAIIKRELSAYFRSPVGYVFCAVYLFFSALYFRAVLIDMKSAQFPEIYSGMLNINLLILPVLTMRLFSEERKQKTDQVLITSPVSIPALVMGKFLSALSIYAGCTLFTLVYAVVFSLFTSPGWALIIGNIVGDCHAPLAPAGDRAPERIDGEIQVRGGDKTELIIALHVQSVAEQSADERGNARVGMDDIEFLTPDERFQTFICGEDCFRRFRME